MVPHNSRAVESADSFIAGEPGETAMGTAMVIAARMEAPIGSRTGARLRRNLRDAGATAPRPCLAPSMVRPSILILAEPRAPRPGPSTPKRILPMTGVTELSSALLHSRRPAASDYGIAVCAIRLPCSDTEGVYANARTRSPVGQAVWDHAASSWRS